MAKGDPMLCSNKIIVALNFITFLLGIAMFAGAIYLFVSPNYKAYASETFIWVSGGAGIAMALLSMFGCWGAGLCGEERKMVLFVYLFFLVCLLGLQIAGAYFIAVYLNVLGSQTVAGYKASDISNSIAAETNNLILSTYTNCCSGCPNDATVLLFPGSKCNATQEVQVNKTASLTSVNCPTASCLPVEICTSNSTGCYSFINGAKPIVPPYTFALETCNALTKLKYNNTALVGPAASGSCGNGSPRLFQARVAAYAYSYSNWVLGLAIALCVFQGLLVLSVLGAMCCDPKKKKG